MCKKKEEDFVDNILESSFSNKQAGSNLVARTPLISGSSFGLKLESNKNKSNNMEYFYTLS
jgi:hypothetical protein